MPRVRITRTAATDLDTIQTQGLAEFGAEATREFMAGFDRIFARLAAYPLHGVAMPEYGRAVRACLHRPFRVLYRYEGSIITILRVMHLARRARPVDETRP